MVTQDFEESVDTTQAVVTGVDDDAAMTVAVKTKHGGRKGDISKTATITAGQQIASGGEELGGKVKQGVLTTFQITRKDGKGVAHAIHQE